MNTVHAAPSSTSSFATVFFDAPVMRTVERIDIPSIRHRTIMAREEVSRRFILTIMLDGGAVVNTGIKVIDCQYISVILELQGVLMSDLILVGTDGRKRSGKARMAKMTTEQRREFGKKAAAARWENRGQADKIYEPEAVGDLPIIGHEVPVAVIVSFIDF